VKRASLEEDEKTSILAMKFAKWLQTKYNGYIHY